MPITLSPEYWWLIVGAAFLLLEVAGIPGIGFLFGGLAAVFTGILVALGFISPVGYYAQFGVFFFATVVCAAMLWNKLRFFRGEPAKGGHYRHMTGSMATVHGGSLKPGHPGQAMWSGALMNAELAPGNDAEISAGSRVEIVDVRGNTLVVKPKE